MANIESVLQENRVFPPAADVVKNANDLRHGGLRGAVPRSRARLRRVLGAPGAREPALAQAVHAGARREQRAVLQVVRTTASSTPRTTASTGISHSGPATRSRSSSRPTTARSRRSPTRICYRARLPVRQRHQGARHQEGRARASSTCRCRSRRWSRCRPARASAPPTRWCSAASRPRACRSAWSMPARSRSSPPTSRCAAARRSPLKPAIDEAFAHGRLRGRAQRHRLQAHRQRGAMRTPARHLVARRRARPAGRLRARVGRTPSIRCSSSTRRARPASPRACSTPPAATCCRPC